MSRKSRSETHSLAVATAPKEIDLSAIERVLIKGDLSGLNDEQRVQYNHAVCQSIGVNPLTNPFSYITLNGKLVLYAKREASEQLRKLYDVSLTIVDREQAGDIYIVTAQAKLPNGRCDESTGVVNVKGLSGEVLANAYMKAETKAKRRVTLSICGLGFLDETEIDSADPGAPSDLKPPAQDVASEITQPEPPKPRTKGEIAGEVLTVARKLGMTDVQLTQYIQEDWKKSTKELTVEEFEQVLEALQVELGRNGERTEA